MNDSLHDTYARTADTLCDTAETPANNTTTSDEAKTGSDDGTLSFSTKAISDPRLEIKQKGGPKFWQWLVSLVGCSKGLVGFLRFINLKTCNESVYSPNYFLNAIIVNGLLMF